MKPHTKIYFDFFNYDESSFIPCEVCRKKAVDIHHINARGMGGNKSKDEILNLMAVCRECHELMGDKKQHKDFLREQHIAIMIKLQPEKTEKLLNEIYSR